MNATATAPLLPRPPRLSRRAMSMLVVGFVAVAGGSFAAGRATASSPVAAPEAEPSRLGQSSASLHAAGVDTVWEIGVVNGPSLHAAGVDTVWEAGVVNGPSLHAAGVDT